MKRINKRQEKGVRQLASIFCLLSIVSLLILSGCSTKNDHSHSQEYTCPMHLTVLQGKPGTCPVCGMDLVLKGKVGNEVKITPELNYLLKPTNISVVASIKVITPILKSETITVETNGIITYDTRRVTAIPIRIGGRIEKLMIKYNFQSIHKGEMILEIYSPELVTAQRDLLFLLKSDTDNAQLIESAKEKLRLLGVTDQQIAQITTSKNEMYSFPVYSPVNGYILEESSESDRSKSTELQTREGVYVTNGQTIFKVINAEQVWAEFNVRQDNALEVKLKDSISLSFDQSLDEIQSSISFIQPFYQQGENFIKVRIYLSNPKNKYKIGQLVKGRMKKESEKSLWIPSQSAMDLGTDKIVFVKRNGTFRPKSIISRQTSGDWIAIASGVEAQDSIAYDAQFLVDSESFIKIKN